MCSKKILRRTAFTIAAMTIASTLLSQVYDDSSQLSKNPTSSGEQFNLASRYLNGRGVAKDYGQAVHWFERSAGQGNVYALANLGVIYRDGIGVPASLKTAFEWFMRAAEAGHDKSQFDVGMMYLRGEGTEKNEIKAVEWVKKAAAQELDVAECKLGVFYHAGVGNLPEDNRESVRWYSQAAGRGNTLAQTLLAKAYLTGTGIPKNEIEALAWLYLASSAGDLPSKEAVAKIERSLGELPRLEAQARASALNQQIGKQKKAR